VFTRSRVHATRLRSNISNGQWVILTLLFSGAGITIGYFGALETLLKDDLRDARMGWLLGMRERFAAPYLM
jgi:hypothetical protein